MNQPVTLSQLKTAVGAAKAVFDRILSDAHPGATEWHWIRACEHIAGQACRRNDDTSRDAAMAADASVKDAWGNYITALNAFYALRDGPRGILGGRI